MKKYYSKYKYGIFKAGELFEINGKEYELKHITTDSYYRLEPIIFRTTAYTVTSGMNEILSYSEMLKIKRIHT